MLCTIASRTSSMGDDQRVEDAVLGAEHGISVVSHVQQDGGVL